MKYDPMKNGRSSGIVVPLQALRSEASPACGEFPDLALLGSLASKWGFDLLQLLPVNDSGFQSSPYSALSAFALHPLYLSIAALPELAAEAAAGGKKNPAQALLKENAELAARFAGDGRFRYGPYLDAKLCLLEKIWREVAGVVLAAKAEAAEFEAWIAANPWVKAYAVFVELKRANGGLPWWQWKAHRDPKDADIEALWAGSGGSGMGFDGGEFADDKAFASACRFRAWLQWRAEGQFRAAKASLDEAGVALMGDIPILINEDSADVWARRSVFRLGLAAGAPPDMYAALGQNWGFPIYDWEAAEADGYSFWKARLACAEKYYSAYRIDHVLGFFRIWSLSTRDSSGYLGRFVPDSYIGRAELEVLGFGPERLRWLSQPHIPTSRLLAATRGDATAAMEAQSLALDRIGNEELFLFKPEIKGEKDIEALARAGKPGFGTRGMSPEAKDCLLASWRDRVLCEFEPGRFVPAWTWRGASAWPTLSDEERRRLEELFARKRAEGESGWEANGRKLLSVLSSSTSMLPCAEDLGSVPGCVPRVLGELGIMGLRVLRWTREWGRPGDPYVEVGRYPELTVACPSVHDSSTAREWYEREADRGQVWALASRCLGRELGPAPERYTPEAAAVILELVARAASAASVYPIQDLLALGEAFRLPEPGAERINVPGNVNDWNWGWRLPAKLEEIAADGGLCAAARKLAAARTGRSARAAKP